MSLPIKPPFPPMEALLVDEIPEGDQWHYEPKWDGFRCLAFRDGDNVYLQSKAGQPLSRYFPELVEGFRKLAARKFVLDGEIAIPMGSRLSFDELLTRIHPAESRIRKLSAEHPAIFIAFDLLVNAEGRSLVKEPLRKRRQMLDNFGRRFLKGNEQIRLSPSTVDIAVARKWFKTVGGDLDGIIAKRAEFDYRSGERTGMEKIKPIRTVDCVIGGFRYAEKKKVVGSLLLGLYDDDDLLYHVGFCSGLKTRRENG